MSRARSDAAVVRASSCEMMGCRRSSAASSVVVRFSRDEQSNGCVAGWNADEPIATG